MERGIKVHEQIGPNLVKKVVIIFSLHKLVLVPWLLCQKHEHELITQSITRKSSDRYTPKNGCVQDTPIFALSQNK